MLRHRAIPCLLLKGDGLVKTVRFGRPTYIGDPINAVRLFNDMEVDELLFLDITATIERREPGYERLRDIAGEAFMPLAYGGGVRSIDQARQVFEAGFEKVVITSAAAENPNLVGELSREFGSQSIVVGLDIKRRWFRPHSVMIRAGRRATRHAAVPWAMEMQRQGAGEIFINSIDRDGTRRGFDLELIRAIGRNVTVPVVACGGAGRLEDLREAVRAGASAAAAGSLFVFAGPRNAVLINYPARPELDLIFSRGGTCSLE